MALENHGAPRPYPRLITDASHRATDERIDAIASLRPLARMLLQKIIRSVCIHDFTKPAHISNQTFIQTLRVSLRTVCRLKVELEHAGLITRKQEKSRRRGMQVSQIWLTEKAQHLLFCAIPTPKTASAPVSNAIGSPQSTSHRASEKSSPSTEAPIPDDVLLLNLCGISETGIYKLMGMARDAGHYLGHIVRAAEKNIAMSKAPFSYIRKLIANPCDWAKRAIEVVQAEQAATAEAREQSQREADMECIKAAMQTTDMLASAKRSHVWILDDGWVKKAEVEAVVQSPRVQWMPLIDISAVAKALRQGKLFAVDRPTLKSWVAPAESPAAPEVATEKTSRSALVTMANAICLSQSLSERHPGGDFAEQNIHKVQTAVDQEVGLASTHEPTCQTNGISTTTIVGIDDKPRVGSHSGWNAVATLMDSCGIAHSGQQRARRVEPEVNPSQPEPAPRNLDLEVIQQAMQGTGMLVSAKRTHVWAWVDGWVKKAEVRAVMRPSGFVQWMPLLDIGPVAEAVRQGKLFAVDHATLGGPRKGTSLP
ncbi:MAG: hypothetical protein K2Q11_12345 [Burkholderiaceae bacterium]|nr:hypothetical protein [Burkholderiaceae bacterium]